MKILYVSLGCDKNLVDSEVMLGLIKEQGYQFTDHDEEADIIVVNTCSFINDAKEESINTILEMAEYKKTGNCKALIVTGCLAQRYKNDIIDQIEEVDAILGTSSYDEIVHAIDEALKGEKVSIFKDINEHPKTLSERVVTTGGYFAYLKIAEGCDNLCTYCIIPKLKGKFRSRPMEDLVAEATTLAQKGIKELILVAQDTTLYGVDLYDGKQMLPQLLEQLSAIEGIQWIRLLYCYPEAITDELIMAMKQLPNVCHYFDLPIQHAHDEILKKMGRKTTQASIRRTIEKIKAQLPNVALRTTLITGFPGETEEQHEAVIEFIKDIGFDRLGVFTYSQEEDTPAALLPDQIDEEIKKERQEEIMLVQQRISEEKSKEMIGKELEVLIEGWLPDEEVYIGRSYKDAPNVDGYVFLSANKELISGDLVQVKITEASEYDLIGEMIQ
jgi:ribosomal protein S12 methylthiotransferase